MPTPVTSSLTSEDRRAAAVARAEQGLAMLDELAVVGMAMSKEIAVRYIDGPYYPEPKHDPAKQFAASSRAVRLTVALQGKVDTLLLAFCNVEPLPIETAGRAREQTDVSASGEAPAEARDDREGEDTDTRSPRGEERREGLVEREGDGEVSLDQFVAAVNAIRADLRLDPDHAEPPKADTPIDATACSEMAEPEAPVGLVVTRPDGLADIADGAALAAAHAAAAHAETAALRIRPHPRQ